MPPDIHIFAAGKHPWLVLPPAMPALAEFYRHAEHWQAASLARFAELRPKIKALQMRVRPNPPQAPPPH